MFEESLCTPSILDRTRRSWTTLASFAMQAIGLTTLFTLPLLYTEGLPQLHLRDLLLAPPPNVISPPRVEPAVAQPIPTANLAGGRLLAPRQIPLQTYKGPDPELAPPMPTGSSPMGVDHGFGVGTSGITSIFSTPIPPVPAAPARPRPVVVSRWMEGNLIRKVQPVYPPLARSAGIQGSVLLQAIIGHDGKIERVQVVSGHPLLTKAAVDAVAQWLYRPYYLNDQAVEVETQVTVNFVLGR